MMTSQTLGSGRNNPSMRTERTLPCGCKDIVSSNAIGFVQYWVPCEKHMEPSPPIEIKPGTVPTE